MIRLITIWLPPHRQQWRQAMQAEYASIDGRWARAVFLAGCARTVLWSALADDNASVGPRIAIIAGGFAILVLGLVSEVIVSSAPSSGGHGALYTVAATAIGIALLAVYLLAALRQVQVRGRAGTTGRRVGLLAGTVIGVIVVLGNTPIAGSPSEGWSAGIIALSTFAVVFGGAVVAGRQSATRTRDRRAGPAAGVWLALTSGAVLIVGLLGLTLLGVGWFTHDPATMQAYHRSLTVDYPSYATHFATITGYVRSENQDTALIGGLFLLPIITMTGAAIGGLVTRTDTPALD
jgi:hypothetical protein